MAKTLRGLPTILVGMLLIAVLFTAYTAQKSLASHEPANKVAAAGTEANVFGPGTDAILLEETVRVASPTDLILSVTLECSIITALHMGDDDSGAPSTDSDSAEGRIDVWVEIDGDPVPVSSDDATDTGKVTFCNQMHQQRITDSENQGATNQNDGVDTFDDYLRTKTANSFNWLALNTGFTYDDDGDNIVNIVVKGRLVDTTAGTTVCSLGDESCSEAIVGHRTLIAEPTNASVHEAVSTTGAGQ